MQYWNGSPKGESDYSDLWQVTKLDNCMNQWVFPQQLKWECFDNSKGERVRNGAHHEAA